MTRRLEASLLVLALGASASGRAQAQKVLAGDSVEPSRRLRDHFGVDLAARLLQSADPDDRLRALERAATIGTPEGISLLVHAVKDPLGAARLDPRALLVIVRGLADATGQSEVRQLLRESILDSSALQHAAPGSGEEAEGADRDARLALARSIAALALATSPDPRAVDAVMLVAQDAGPGQAAAEEALAAFPTQRVATVVTGPWPPPLLRLAATIGDLRVLDSLRGALAASDPATHAAALDAASELGDTRAIDAARSATKDADPRVREAGTRALVRLGAPERARAVEALIGDVDTAREGARLAELVGGDRVARALAARVAASSDPEVRTAAIVALGRNASDDAVRALTELAKNPFLEGDASEALARSPSGSATGAILGLLGATRTRRLGARACAVRALTRGEGRATCTTTLRAMATSREARDRAVGLSALVFLGLCPARDALSDRDAGVRRAVAMAALGSAGDAAHRDLLLASLNEPDALARRTMMGGLIDADTGGIVPTMTLFERALAGEDDAPIAAMALAARADPAHREHVRALFAWSDPVVRAHVARGLGKSRDADATGQLADAYRFETEPIVRRAIVLALGERTQDANAPARLRVLTTARHLDPDGPTREESARALADLPAAPPRDPQADVAWVRLVTRAGTGPAGPAFSGVLIRSDGIALPVAFDEDGYALVPIPRGDSRLRLAPRLHAYDALEP